MQRILHSDFTQNDRERWFTWTIWYAAISMGLMCLLLASAEIHEIETVRASLFARGMDEIYLGLFGIWSTSLVFGLWDSTGPQGDLGAKFQRTLVSEIVGYDAVPRMKATRRLDPARITLGAGPLCKRETVKEDAPDWTLTEARLKLGGGRSPTARPSEANHGNVTPSIFDGGFAISGAKQTTILSLAVLRRLRSPLDGTAVSDRQVDLITRMLPAALGIAAGPLAREDVGLRSRCHLLAEGASAWQLGDCLGRAPAEFAIHSAAVLRIPGEAIREVTDIGLPWNGEVRLMPAPELVELVRCSQELAGEDGAEAD